MIELTPREIKGVGYNRYFVDKKRQWKSVGLVCLGLVLALVFTTLTDKYLNDFVRGVVMVIIVGVSFIPTVKITSNANKEGKKFLERWQKEKQEVK